MLPSRRQLDTFFKITERGSTIRTEIVAGFVNFIANAYLLVIVPQLLQNGGVDPRLSVTGFVVSTFVSSTLLGLASNLPVAAGPGLGCAAYFAYGLSKTPPGLGEGGTDWCLTTCLASGAAMTALALLNVPSTVFAWFPGSVKDAMPVGLGLLLSLCGFQEMKLVVPDAKTGLTMTGDVLDPRVLLGLAGAASMAFLHAKHVKAAFLIPIAVITAVAWATRLAPAPTEILAAPMVPSPLWAHVDPTRLDGRSVLPSVALYVICLFDIAGVMFGVCRIAGLVSPRDGSLEGAPAVFVCCGLGSLLAPMLGCTPVIALGESFAGVLVGGRTGLVPIVMAACFALSLPFYPVFSAIPTFASSPVLVMLGVSLTGLVRSIDLDDGLTAFPAFCTLALMPFLYSIDHAITAGLLAHAVLASLDALHRLVLRGAGTSTGAAAAGTSSGPGGQAEETPYRTLEGAPGEAPGAAGSRVPGWVDPSDARAGGGRVDGGRVDGGRVDVSPRGLAASRSSPRRLERYNSGYDEHFLNRTVSFERSQSRGGGTPAFSSSLSRSFTTRGGAFGTPPSAVRARARS
jgi:AGZA family xanthine/uracil permease-like MFS transporter